MELKIVLVLGAGVYQCEIIKQLRELGLHVIAADKDSMAPGSKIANEFINIDIVDKEAVLHLSVEKNIDAIIPVNDFGVRTASYVAERMNLIGISAESAELSNNKIKMRERWKEYNLRQPNFEKVVDYNQLEDAADKLGYPLIIKPADCGGGSRGVLKILSETDLVWAFEIASKYTYFSNEIIAERYIPGTEVTVEGICYEHKAKVLAISDKVHFDSVHYCVASSLNYPAALSPIILNEIERLTDSAVKALGLNNCLFHIEMMIHNDSPYLIELGARGGGGHIQSSIVPWVSGINYIQEYSRILLGEKIHIEMKEKKGAVFRFLSALPGRIVKIEGIEEINQMDKVPHFECLKKVGDTISQVTMDNERIGFLVAFGSNRDEALYVAETASDLLKIVTE